MKYTKIPYSYDWDDIVTRMEEEEDFDTCKIEQDMISLIDHPSIKWTELPDDAKLEKDGLYVYDPDNYEYAIVYKGEVILELC